LTSTIYELWSSVTDVLSAVSIQLGPTDFEVAFQLLFTDPARRSYKSSKLLLKLQFLMKNRTFERARQQTKIWLIYATFEGEFFIFSWAKLKQIFPHIIAASTLLE
jgi:hypothetical protein